MNDLGLYTFYRETKNFTLFISPFSQIKKTPIIYRRKM